MRKLMPVLPKSSNNDNAPCHYPLFSHALIAASNVITLWLIHELYISASNNNDRCHRPPFSRTEVATMKLITSRLTPALHMFFSNDMDGYW